MILFSIIAMLSGARSYRQIHTLIDRRLAILNAAFPQAALRRSPAYTSVRGILQRLDPAELERAFRRHAEGLDRSCAAAPSRFIAIDGKTLRQSRPCDRSRRVDVTLAPSRREACKRAKMPRRLLELDAKRPAQRDVSLDVVHQHGSLPTQGCAISDKRAKSTLA